MPKDASRKGVIEKAEISITEADIRTKVVDVAKSLKDIADIGEAKILVSGGRGVGNKENFALIKELADVLGGTVSVHVQLLIMDG